MELLINGLAVAAARKNKNVKQPIAFMIELKLRLLVFHFNSLRISKTEGELTRDGKILIKLKKKKLNNLAKIFVTFLDVLCAKIFTNFIGCVCV